MLDLDTFLTTLYVLIDDTVKGVLTDSGLRTKHTMSSSHYLRPTSRRISAEA